MNRKRKELTVKGSYWYVFTPMLFLIKGGAGRECQKFYSRLAQPISEKSGLPQSISSNWIRKKVYFGLLKSSLLCLRGLRTLNRKTAKFGLDVNISHTVAEI